jgi:hypothetical protein
MAVAVTSAAFGFGGAAAGVFYFSDQLQGPIGEDGATGPVGPVGPPGTGLDGLEGALVVAPGGASSGSPWSLSLCPPHTRPPGFGAPSAVVTEVELDRFEPNLSTSTAALCEIVVP